MMISISKSTALVAALVLSTVVMAAEAGATSEVCPALDWVSVEGEEVQLPTDVAEQVTMLQGYGARYARVIDLVIEENARPDWTFAEDCGASGSELVASGG